MIRGVAPIFICLYAIAVSNTALAEDQILLPVTNSIDGEMRLERRICLDMFRESSLTNILSSIAAKCDLTISVNPVGLDQHLDFTLNKIPLTPECRRLIIITGAGGIEARYLISWLTHVCNVSVSLEKRTVYITTRSAKLDHEKLANAFQETQGDWAASISNKLNRLVTLSIDDAQLGEVLQYLAVKGDFPMVIAPALFDGNQIFRSVSIHDEKRTYGEMLRTLLVPSKAMYYIQGGVLYVNLDKPQTR